MRNAFHSCTQYGYGMKTQYINRTQLRGWETLSTRNLFVRNFMYFIRRVNGNFWLVNL